MWQSMQKRMAFLLQGLIVENTFISVDGMVDVLLPFLSPLKGILLKNHYDSSKIAHRTKVAHSLYLAGDADEIVPYSQMKELYESSCKAGAQEQHMHVVKGDRLHNDTWLQGGKAYWNAIREFLYA